MMFNKLRNRFLIVNMVIITFIMLVAFAAIYSITYRNVHHDINMDIVRVSDFYRSSDLGGDKPRPIDDLRPQPAIDDRFAPQDPSLSYRLQTDEEWQLIEANSRFDMDEEFYQEAIDRVADSQSDIGQLSLDGYRWAYLIQSMSTGYSIVYLDISAQQKILTNLVYTFLLVGLAMLIMIYFTSRFFANRSIAPVQEAFDKQKQFIADASHELKTPLAVIQTNADVLLANSEATIDSQSKWIHRMKSETERMKTLTNDLLYLTEMDDSRERMIEAPFNLSEAVESVILTMEAIIYERSLTLQYDIVPDIMLHGNSEQMKQVVMILLDNSIKYTNKKGSITLSLQRKHGDILLEVTNTGEGIAFDHLERIFDRFFRADASRSRKQGGHGLGLAIARSIVEQHKGRIYAKSVQGQSTTIHVRLP